VDTLAPVAVDGTPLPKEAPYKVFDPRRGEVWLQPTSGKDKVCLREHGILVVDYQPRRRNRPLQPEDFYAFVRTSMLRTGGQGFFSLNPYTKAMRAPGVIPKTPLNESAHSVLGYFDLDTETIDRYLQLRRLTSYEEWVFGSCQRQFANPPKTRWYQPDVPWTAEYLFTQVGNIGSLALFDGDSGIVRVYSRVYPDINEQLNELARRMR
jgi:hypothetical protein